MRLATRGLLFAAIFIALIGSLPRAWGQQVSATSSTSMGPEGMSSSMDTNMDMSAMMKPVVGEPYWADKVRRSVQHLADGTLITSESKGVVARDAEGRTRQQMSAIVASGAAGTSTTNTVMVIDPVGHSMTTWSEGSKIAMVRSIPDAASVARSGGPGTPIGSLPMPRGIGRVELGVPTAPSAATRPRVQVDDLGQQSIGGVLATGKRLTTTIPTGAIGNDRPIASTHEMWVSAELGLTVKEVNNDPRTGEQTMELENVTRGDPDAALFHAPAGYRVIDTSSMTRGAGGGAAGKETE